jgi:AcrR family transcriptional regulator
VARSPSYHHGDLRSALIEAGLGLLETRDGDPGLREVARAVGVSATAVYRHFPDKEALLAALASAGLNRLATAQRRAARAAGGGVAGFNATGRAYVRFALAHPALFRLIFAKAPKTAALPFDAKAEDAIELLRENAAQLLAGTTSDPATIRLFALRAWALVHGLAVLLLEQRLDLDQQMIDAIIDAHDFSFVPRPA